MGGFRDNPQISQITQKILCLGIRGGQNQYRCLRFVESLGILNRQVWIPAQKTGAASKIQMLAYLLVSLAKCTPLFSSVGAGLNNMSLAAGKSIRRFRRLHRKIFAKVFNGTRGAVNMHVMLAL